jgi:RNA polymerase sigma-70 factor, ECF subfamily
VNRLPAARPGPNPSVCLMVTQSRAEEFLTLYSGCQRWLLAYLMALLGNRNDAEEVFQETTLALWRSFDEFTPGRDFTRWAKGVAFHRVLAFRKRKRRSDIPQSDEFLEAVHSADDRQADLAVSRLHALEDCVRRLPEADRRLISLRYSGKETIPELATQLNRSTSGVSKALRRIRRALANCVKRSLSREGFA